MNRIFTTLSDRKPPTTTTDTPDLMQMFVLTSITLHSVYLEMMIGNLYEVIRLNRNHKLLMTSGWIFGTKRKEMMTGLFSAQT